MIRGGTKALKKCYTVIGSDCLPRVRAIGGEGRKGGAVSVLGLPHSCARELVVVAVDGDTAVVRDGTRHGSHARDDSCGGVVTLHRVRGLPVLPATSQDEDLSIAHRHSTALLQEKQSQTQ